MPRNQRGFTLIELMLVIAILGIILAIAVPAYRDYTVRAKVSEGLRIASWAKVAVEETWFTNGAVPDQASTGFSFTGTTSYVSTVTIAGDGSGTVSIETQNTGADPNVTVALEPDLGPKPIEWVCRITQGQDRHVPPNCRN